MTLLPAGEKGAAPRFEDHLDRMVQALAGPASEIEPAGALRLLDQAHRLLAHEQEAASLPDPIWHRYLDLTRRPAFLQALGSPEARREWAETTFKAIGVSGFGFDTLMEQRVQAHPEHIFLQEFAGDEPISWTYRQVARRCRQIAAFLLSLPEADPLSVALLADNRLDLACCDLACLIYGIPVTPLSVYLDRATLTHIFRRLAVTVAVADTPERIRRLQEVAVELNRPLTIVALSPEGTTGGHDTGVPILEEALTRLDPDRIEALLADRPRPGTDQPATVLYTSGSTGHHRGVVFTPFHMLSKRFARAAALPEVGEQETLLCYLPLYHTFGRFLELQGMFFWGGTYVFAGTTAADRYLDLIARVEPTGLIGVPARWHQLYEQCRESIAQAGSNPARQQAFRRVVGSRLRWGLSAAGHQEPAVFHFFERHGVALCSGFGMTETAGGVTMTPPGLYEDGTVGIPLPGVRIRFTGQKELLVAAPYVGRYLDPEPDTEEGWVRTGDLFRVRSSGYLEIVDRVKDIYKNSRGQTIAPLRVERLFDGVPGIRRTFLVGDRRDYNVLLIVPDPEDPVLRTSGQGAEDREFYHRIITAANLELPPFERILHFAVLERDFDRTRDELTPKGSYRRKVIERNFSDLIEQLYQRPDLVYPLAGVQVHIPRWFFRNLGILEGDITIRNGRLENRRSRRSLRVEPLEDHSGWVRIGDLEYHLEGSELDLGMMARQPRFWLGNHELVAFAPCRQGWDSPLEGCGRRVRLPSAASSSVVPDSPEERSSPTLPDGEGARLHHLLHQALFGEIGQIHAAIEALERLLGEVDLHRAEVIRCRLEALARHPDLNVRAHAYRVLLLDQPIREDIRALRTFVESELPFLNRESIELIASVPLEPSRLLAFRRQLQAYRHQLEWPTSRERRDLFFDLFQLLEDFARYHPEFYATVRCELVSWALHEIDPELALGARRHLRHLAAWFRESIEQDSLSLEPTRWEGKLVFPEGLEVEEVDFLRRVLIGSTFLDESIVLAFDQSRFDITQVKERGIWITRILSLHHHRIYRLSVSTHTRGHYDLLVVRHLEGDREQMRTTNFWMMALHGAPGGPPVVPPFGTSRERMGVFSLAYLSDLTLWERIREYSSPRAEESGLPPRSRWRTLFVRGMAAYFSAWHRSDGRIVPGGVTPGNVVVPEPDYREGTAILSLAGWRPFQKPASLVEPMVYHFYRQTVGLYPRAAQRLELPWIFEGVIEALGLESGRTFLADLANDLLAHPISCEVGDLPATLESFRAELEQRYHVPLIVRNARARYQVWRRLNPEATPQACGAQVEEIIRLYRIDRLPVIARYHLYRHTYFESAPAPVAATFDRLLERMFRDSGRRPTQMVELSDLQASLTEADDRAVFARLVYPTHPATEGLEIIPLPREGETEVVVRSRIFDKSEKPYTVRAPLEPAEIGRFYRIFITSGYPITLSDQAYYLLVLEEGDQLAGGLQYRLEPDEVAHIDGLLMAPSHRERGLSGALLEDFCARMAAQGVEVVKTYYHQPHFFLYQGFQVHRRWGGLVRFLR